MNQIDLTERVAVVTGGARGIGRAVVKRFLESGARCAIWDRDETEAKSWVSQLSDPSFVQVIPVELTQPESVVAATERTQQLFGGIDIAVNNAGIAGVSKKLWECEWQEWRDVIELDLMAVFYVCHALVPVMLDAGYGRIINIASIAGKEGNPNASHYSAAKSGVIGLTKSLGKELAESGIHVNCVTPAVIQTDILNQVSQEHIDYMVSKIQMKRVGQPEEVAALVAWLASGDCSFTTGAVYDISGGRATY